MISFGFSSIQGGPSRGAYHHEKFVRGKRGLCREIQKKDPTCSGAIDGSGEPKCLVSHSSLSAVGLVTTPAIQQSLAEETVFDRKVASSEELARQMLPPVRAIKRVSIDSEFYDKLPKYHDSIQGGSQLALGEASMGQLQFNMRGAEESSDSISYQAHESTSRMYLPPNAAAFNSNGSILASAMKRNGPHMLGGSTQPSSTTPPRYISQSMSINHDSCYTLAEEGDEPPPTPIAKNPRAASQGLSNMSLFSMDLDDILADMDPKETATKPEVRLENSCSSGPMLTASMDEETMKQRLSSSSSEIGATMFSSTSWADRLSEEEGAGSSSDLSTASSATERRMTFASNSNMMSFSDLADPQQR